MAHNVEPMDIDNIESDFDNKENSIHHSNVYPRTPCTEKGYEELDVSELNMKLRYSITPAASPMSKSYTANCGDNRSLEIGDDTFNANLTRSLHSAISKGDMMSKSAKSLPLQTIPTDQFVDSHRNASVLRPLDSTVVVDSNVSVTVTQSNDIDENLSLPSLSSSTAQTPEATTPTKEIPRSEVGSPIMRGLKSVLNMFRSSQSPIPPAENTELACNQILSPADVSISSPDGSQSGPAVLASTPIAAHKHREASLSKRSSPHKESIVFNEDLEKELLWKDETTILFSQEKIPIHKLFFQHAPKTKNTAKDEGANVEDNLNSTVEYMDISYNDSIVKNKTITDIQTGLHESDGEFVDCETTFTNDKSVTSVLQGNESISDANQANSNVLPAMNMDVTTNNESMSLHESLKTNLPQSDATITVNEEKDKVQIESVPKCKLTQDKLLVDDGKVDLNPEKTAENDTNIIINANIKIEENVLPSTTQGGLNSTFPTEPLQTMPSPTDMPLMNITFEACDLPTEEIISKPDNNDCHITHTLNEMDVIKSDTIAPQDKVVDSTNIQQVECAVISDVCNTTYSTKSEDTTFVKETVNALEQADVNNKTALTDVEDKTFVKDIERLPENSNNRNTTIPVDVENITFVKHIECESLPVNDSKTFDVKDKDETSVKETESIPIDSNKMFPVNDDYNNFVKEIEIVPALEEKINTSTPSTDTDSPANIPLPDEDDIENEKSLGASMLVEEKTVPVELDIKNTTVTKFDSENNFKEMPIKTAKSIDGNNIINYPIGEKESLTALNLENKEDHTTLLDASIITSHNIVQDGKHVKLDELNINETYSQDISMDINESITGEAQVPIELQPMLTTEPMEHMLDVDIKQVSHDVIKDFQCITKDTESVATNTVVTPRTITEMLETPDKNLKFDVNNVINPDIGDIQTYLESKEAPDVVINDTTGMSNIVSVNNQDNKFVVSELKNNEIDASAIVTEMKMPASEQNTIDAVTDKAIEECSYDQRETNDHSIFKDVHEKLNETSAVINNEKELRTDSSEAIETTNNMQTDVLPTDKKNKTEEEIVNNIIEEIVVSENNSPYVSVADRIDSIPGEPNFEEIQNPFATKSRVVVTPPASPKIVSKGYNFNFDEIDDPFATKTKIRMSPTPENSPTQICNATFEERADPPRRDTNKNRRKSQPERKRPVMPKKKLNSTFSGPVKPPKNANEQSGDIETKNNSSPCEVKIDDLKLSTPKNTLNATINIATESGKPQVLDDSISKGVPKELKSQDDRDVNTATDVNVNEDEKSSIESLHTVSNEVRTPSSSEQSAYFSAGTSSGEGTVTKNVFNIPEIDDMNFNPFATKSKMRQSPPPALEETKTETVSSNKGDSFTSPEVNTLHSDLTTTTDVAPIEDKECANVSNITCSSKATDEKDITVREVHTEDEDTEEGPFLEADDNDKMSDFDGEDVDMMQFSELPSQNIEENLDNGEMFIDAEAFEFLLNQNKTNVVSDSGKESLFLKFDPLFAKRVSTDGVLAALNKVQKRQSTPKKTVVPTLMDTTFEKPIPGPSALNETHEVEANVTVEDSTEDLNVTVSKPMMVVTPAVNPVVTPRNKTTTPTSSNRRSITFTSPAIAVIDRLLSLSANNSLVGHDTTVTHVSREQNEADLALTQLRELLAEKEINVYNLRSETKELRDRLSSLESQMRSLESESEDRLKKVNDLNEKLSEKTKLNKSMAAVVEEYERTIASLIAETEQDKKRHNKERIKLIKERDEQTAHLTSMEVSFSDLHSKYEKSKQIILTYKANEDSYKKSIKEFEENLSKMQSNYELLKQHATSKLNHANQELEKMNRAHESEVLKMNAMIKRKELHITSLEETLAQKTKANDELTAICDELINKVG